MAFFGMLLFVQPAYSQGVLKVSGTQVIDSSGNRFMLRGVNLGGWLVTENWMCGITDTLNEGRSALKTLESRFTPAQVDTLVNTWQDHWITSADLDSISALGFNFVRVPFGWRNLQDQHGQWRLNANGEIDFSRFDWIVSEAAQRNLYVLFDYHIWLKQDSAYNSISDIDTVKKHTCLIWKAVASHFNNNPHVLGYDLLNEPTGSWNDHVMQMIYDTIRSVDPEHIISIEWTNPDTSRWTNVIYQDHYYGMSFATLAENQNYFNAQYLPQIQAYQALNVPFYVGELHGFNSDPSLAWSLEQYCLNDVHWSPWTYKTINMWGWGLISVYPNNVRVNIVTDSYADILAKWQQVSNRNNMYEMTNLKQIWRDGANCINVTAVEESAIGQAALLYPNPTQSMLYIKSSTTQLGKSYDVVDLYGQKVLSGSIQAEKQAISTEGLPAGRYFVRLDGQVLPFVKL
jgi:aryl-phospho-beta-D-glucosidase BglC (GH1 family)